VEISEPHADKLCAIAEQRRSPRLASWKRSIWPNAMLTDVTGLSRT
jgi:hypothetical protein